MVCPLFFSRDINYLRQIFIHHYIYVKLNKPKISFVARNIAMHSIFIAVYGYSMSIKINKATLPEEDSEDQLQ